MKLNSMLIVAALALVTAVACGSTTNNTDAGTGGGGGTGGGAGGGSMAQDFSTSAKILTYLEGKTMVMTGTDLPPYPNGFNANFNFGTSTQCYNKVSIQTLASNFIVTSDLGTFTSIPDAGIVGSCNTGLKSATISFTSSAVLIENVASNGACFDITATYTGFSQAGRGSISPDGKKVTLELYFSATHHRCVDGNPGAATVLIGTSTTPFTGNSLQVYRIP